MKKLIENTKDIDPEIQQVVNDNYWEMLNSKSIMKRYRVVYIEHGTTRTTEQYGETIIHAIDKATISGEVIKAKLVKEHEQTKTIAKHNGNKYL
jgi:hypothetical protein